MAGTGPGEGGADILAVLPPYNFSLLKRGRKHKRPTSAGEHACMTANVFRRSRHRQTGKKWRGAPRNNYRHSSRSSTRSGGGGGGGGRDGGK